MHNAHNHSNYSVNLPYPAVEIELPCRSDLNCIIDDYGGPESETTAIFQYVYQSYITENEENLHKTLLGISISEMRHHELLGEAIVKLGGMPMIGGRKSYWTGKNVNYCKDISAFLRYNITIEHKAIDAYRQSIRCLKNYSLKQLIERIILDEEHHIEIFGELLKEYDCR